MQPSCMRSILSLHRQNIIDMKKAYLLTLIYAGALLMGCQSHTHEEHDHEHEHEEQETHEQEEHHLAAGEIVFSEEKAAAVGLQTEEVAVGAFQEAVRVSGRLTTPKNKTQVVVAAMDGVITVHKHISDGSVVKRGQELAHISVRGMAEADPVETALIQYEAARKEYERAQALTNNQIVSAQEMEQISLRYQTAKSRYEALKDKKATDGCIEISAPQDGYVSAIHFANGDHVSAGDPLFTIAQTQELLLEVDVPERYWNKLSKIQTANFAPAYSEEVYSLSKMNGRLLSVDRVADSQSGYLPVVFSFTNKVGLVAGAYVDAYLLLSESQDALSVPVSALTEDQGVYSVYIQLDEDCYRKQDVRIGQSNGERVLIESGLHAGERVVTQGVMQVKLAGSATVIPGHTHHH